LGHRRRADGIDALFVSDLWRAVETAQIAFAGCAVPMLLDWRLRECDYGQLNGAPSAVVHDRAAYLDTPYPGGESWRDAVTRVGRVLPDLATRWDGRRVLVIGHVARVGGSSTTYWAHPLSSSRRGLRLARDGAHGRDDENLAPDPARRPVSQSCRRPPRCATARLRAGSRLTDRLGSRWCCSNGCSAC
jgi:hypothetical protein